MGVLDSSCGLGGIGIDEEVWRKILWNTVGYFLAQINGLL